MIIGRFDLVDVLSKNTTTKFKDLTDIDPNRIVHTLNQLHMTMVNMDIGENGHIDAYAINDNVITIACILNRSYDVSTTRTMSLALAKQILTNTYPHYTIEAYVLCFEIMRVHKISLKPGELYEARRCL